MYLSNRLQNQGVGERVLTRVLKPYNAPTIQPNDDCMHPISYAD